MLPCRPLGAPQVSLLLSAVGGDRQADLAQTAPSQRPEPPSNPTARSGTPAALCAPAPLHPAPPHPFTPVHPTSLHPCFPVPLHSTSLHLCTSAFLHSFTPLPCTPEPCFPNSLHPSPHFPAPLHPAPCTPGPVLPGCWALDPGHGGHCTSSCTCSRALCHVAKVTLSWKPGVWAPLPRP